MLTPGSIRKKILLHEQKTQRNDRRIIQRADDGKRIGHKIQRIQHIEQCEYSGAQGPARHLAVGPVPRVADEVKQQSPIVEKAFQWTVAAEARLNGIGLSHDPFDITIRHVRSACIKKARVNARKLVSNRVHVYRLQSILHLRGVELPHASFNGSRS